MATIKDVAREAGVSITTVSFYLNKTKPISKETAKAIQAAIDKLQYSHNVLARNLRTKRNVDIGVILPNLEDSYYAQVFRGIKSYFRDTEYSVLVEFSENIPEFEKDIAENFLQRQVCGLFLVSCQPNNWKFYYDNFTSKGIPIVLIDRRIHSLDANFVSFDNYKLMKRLAERLLKKGHREIYLVSGPEEYTCEADSVRGFTDACRSYGVSVTSDMFIKTDMSKEDAFRKTIRLLKYKKPEAVVTTTEALAMGAIEGLTVLNSGAEEIPVATFSEEHWNYHTRFAASEYAMRTAINLGKTASELMKKQLDEPFTSETEKIILTDCYMATRQNVTGNQRNLILDKPKKIRILLLKGMQGNALLRLIQNFEITTGIEVESNVMNYRAFLDTVIRNFHEELPYDVFMYAMPWLPFLVSKHMMADITEETKELKGTFFENVLEHFGCYKGKCYGLPILYGPQFLYYRKDLFEDPELKKAYEKVSSISLRPPVTLKEFNTIADFFTNKTDVIPYGITIPGAYNTCLVQEIYWRLLAFGGKIFDDQGNVSFDCEQTLKAYINFMRSIKHAKPDFRKDNDEDVANAFLQGETAMLISNPAFFMDINDLRRGNDLGAIGCQMVPGRTPLLGGWGMGISSKSNQREEAVEFLRWTCNEQVASYMTLLGGQSAITSVYTNDELVELYPWIQLYHSGSQYAKPIMPPTLANGKVIPLHEIEDVIGKWIYELLDTDIEVQQAITNTHHDLEKLVEKYMNMR